MKSNLKSRVPIIIAVGIVIILVVIIFTVRSFGREEEVESTPTPEPTATIEPTESPEPDNGEGEDIGTMNTGYSETEVEDEVYDSIEDVVAEPSDMDAVINSYDDNLAEEVTDPVEGVDYEVIPVTPMTLYATQTVNLRQGPSADDFAKIGSLSPRQQVTVIGEVREYKGKSVYWWQLDTGEFVSAAYLAETLPPVNNNSGTGTGSTGTGGTGNGGIYGGGNVEVGQEIAPGFTWGGGSGDIPSAGSEYSGIDWQ